MAGGKETTRQKMINIMYLVLLAMLALNVSDTILNAFKNINDSLDSSRTNVSTSIDQLFASFQNTKLKEEPARAQPIWEKANLAKKYADDLNSYIQQLKQQFNTAGGGIDPETGDLKERGNQDIAQGIMINAKEGEKLKAKINDTREKLISLLEKDDRAHVSFSLDAKDPEKSVEGKKKWEDINFGEGTPLTAANTVLTKIQSDTRNAEAEVVKKLFGNMDKAMVNLDHFEAVVVAPTSYVVQGQPYTAEIFLTASDTRSSADISVGGNKLPTKNGKGTYTGSTGAVGVFKWAGSIRVKQTDGTFKEYPTPTQTYQVAKPSATVSPDKMNVIYAGIPNPFSVSAAGFPLESVKASISGGSMSGSNGKYNVSVGGDQIGKVVNITVTASNAGKTLNLGSQQFRVKALPTPKAFIKGKSGGNVELEWLSRANVIETELDDFVFDIKYKVIRFNATFINPRSDAVNIPNNGGSFSGQIKGALNSIKPGATVIFKDIIAEGPDGRQKNLDGITFTAK
ncbi:gliding motility-associated protein GldM [Pedobacter cryoconitis]|uniref:Gliding motility-associated protein GldM n=1 Tax=Pedobacter cryoconitis TaxID=188932 RepID=A0A7W8ZKT0_9SPHI|nr:gliding motility protein GldM [Pedobacter cryoconitis]MBB5635831.1 gliding motility-associated protein GldM [Pedobacter cryoconitis]MBB6273270.1 gliding motility-associated protein GldM [Pedobacter cryoconitis]